MRFLCNVLSLLLVFGAPLIFAAGKKKTPWRPGAASSYANHQTIGNLTIAAHPVGTRAEAKRIFGKADPRKHGLLPILVVMQNDSGKVLNLERMRVEYIRPDRRRIHPVPAEDLPFLEGAKKPGIGPKFPNPIPSWGGSKKNPLAGDEVQGRAFAARMLPPADSASGFFFFQTADHRDAILYITGITEAATGQDLFFFEITID